MKHTSVVRRLLVSGACGSLLLGTTAMAGGDTSESKREGRTPYAQNAAAKPPERIILVEVTGSRIPQRVVLAGQQVTSASPLTIMRLDELNRTGATSVEGMLASDPSITFRRR